MRKGTCKHFCSSVEDRCAKGVAWKTLPGVEPTTPGCLLRAPCIRDHSSPSGRPMPDHWPAEIAKTIPTDCYEEPTVAELAENEKQIEAAIERFKLTLPLCSRIKAEHKGEDWAGVEKCPACGGKLYMRHAAYNGHIHAQCETENCIAFME